MHSCTVRAIHLSFSPVIRLSKDVAAHDWVIDVKCSSNIKFV